MLRLLLLLGVYCVATLPMPGLGLDNGLALTPPLGWRTYNAFGGDVSQDLMEEMMEAMVARSFDCPLRVGFDWSAGAGGSLADVAAPSTHAHA